MIQTAWPDHCVQGQDGDAGLRSTVKTVQGEIIVQKGENKYVDAYVPSYMLQRVRAVLLHRNRKENN